MGTVVKYVAVGYVVLVVLGSLTLVGPEGLWLLVLLLLVGVVWASRKGLPFGEMPTHVLPAPTVAGPLPSPDTLRPRLESLSRDLPDDPLDSPLVVALADLYDHEPPDERERLDQEYHEQRERLVTCRSALERGESEELLRREVDGVEAYVSGLRATAARAGDDPVGAALGATGEASDALAAARVEAGAVEGAAAGELDERLADAEPKLRTAQGAFAKGAERPLLALRLADEVERTAAEVLGRARRLRGLPDELERRLHEFDRAAVRLDRELARVKEDFRTASQQYAPSCWTEVRGVGASAAQSAERARRYRSAAAAKIQTSAAEAKEELDEAFRALERAQALAAKISDHLSRLEEASLTARERVSAAERAIEAGWAANGDRDDDAVFGRSRELVSQARAELEQSRPDWLRAVELAASARGLVQPREAEIVDTQVADGGLETRARAKEVRDDAWAHGLVSDDVETTVRPLLDEVEHLYRRAVEMDAAPRDGDGRARDAEALEAYRLAERRARQVRAEIADVYAGSIARRSRRSETPAPSSEAELLVWGAVAAWSAVRFHD